MPNGFANDGVLAPISTSESDDHGIGIEPMVTPSAQLVRLSRRQVRSSATILRASVTAQNLGCVVADAGIYATPLKRSTAAIIGEVVHLGVRVCRW